MTTYRSSMSRVVSFIMALILLAAAGSSVMATNTDPNSDHKVTLCHRTGSAINPYHEITVDIASSGLVEGGHTGHDQVGNGLGGDIIPSYLAFAKVNGEYEDFFFPGKNLDTLILGESGQSILLNGCQLFATESATPTESPTPVGTSSAVETPTSVVSATTEPLPDGAMGEPGDYTLPALLFIAFIIGGAGALTILGPLGYKKPL